MKFPVFVGVIILTVAIPSLSPSLDTGKVHRNTRKDYKHGIKKYKHCKSLQKHHKKLQKQCKQMAWLPVITIVVIMAVVIIMIPIATITIIRKWFKKPLMFQDLLRWSIYPPISPIIFIIPALIT